MICANEDLGGASGLPPIDSSNQMAVGIRGRVEHEEIMIILPRWRMQGLSAVMTKDQALNLAAWLAVIADPAGDRFGKLLEEIKKS